MNTAADDLRTAVEDSRRLLAKILGDYAEDLKGERCDCDPDYHDPEACERTMDVRLQIFDQALWNSDGIRSLDADTVSDLIRFSRLWTGDASYDHDHRGWWGSDVVFAEDSLEELLDVAGALIDGALDSLAQSFDLPEGI